MGLSGELHVPSIGSISHLQWCRYRQIVIFYALPIAVFCAAGTSEYAPSRRVVPGFQELPPRRVILIADELWHVILPQHHTKPCRVGI